MSVLTDEQLVESALAGSSGAFSELVTRYQDRLLRFLMTRSASRADAEDAVQDTFLNAYRYLASFDSRWRFSTWIYRIAIRNAARQKKLTGHNVDVDVAGDSDPLDECLRYAEQENIWRVARDCLSTDVFNAMWLRYVEDQSMKDISRALDKSASWTKVNLMRARRRLGDELGGETPAAVESNGYG